MKILLLIRHAKSDWADGSLSDFDRSLNERGKKDAPEMASRLLEKKIIPGLLIASPAKRAKKTALKFAEVLGTPEEEVQFAPELYLAPGETFYKLIEQAENKYSTIAVFAHNPGITDFANLLTDTRIDNIPTCGIFGVRVKTDTWGDFEKAEKEFLFFDSPKAGKE